MAHLNSWSSWNWNREAAGCWSRVNSGIGYGALWRLAAISRVSVDIVTWLWGGFSVDNPTLNRFFSLHYLMPFVIVAVVVRRLVLGA